jgi:hypothetical protein
MVKDSWQKKPHDMRYAARHEADCEESDYVLGRGSFCACFDLDI